MQVCEVIDIPIVSQQDGAKTYIASVMNGLKKRGHTTYLIDGSHRPRMFMNRHFILLKQNTDIYHIHEPTTILASNWILRRLKNQKIAVTFHAPISNKTLEKVYFRLGKLFYKNVNVVITQTKRNKDYLGKMGVPNVKAIPLWADSFFTPKKDPLNRGWYCLSVCVIDRYHHYKNFPMMGKIAEFLHQHDVQLIHTGPYDFRIPNVTHVGKTDRHNLRELYRNALLFILPSVAPYEGFGLVAAEALACGTPVLVSQGTGISEYLDPIFVSSLNLYMKKLQEMIELMLKHPGQLIRKAKEESRKFGQENLLSTIRAIEEIHKG